MKHIIIIKYIAILLVLVISNYITFQVAYQYFEALIDPKLASGAYYPDSTKFSKVLISYHEHDTTSITGRKVKVLKLHPVRVEKKEGYSFVDIGKDDNLNGKHYYSINSKRMYIQDNDTIWISAFVFLDSVTSQNSYQISINQYFKQSHLTTWRTDFFDKIKKTH
jgi:hypothetical protein